MKTIFTPARLLSFAFAFLSLTMSAQTATSIASGNFTNPFTWDCTCVPMNGYTVTINHDVVMDTDIAYSSGSITVSPGASFIQDATPRDMWINGGTYTNNGKTQFNDLLAQAGSITNTDTFITAAFANFMSFTNSGFLSVPDSFYNDGTINNSGTIAVPTFYNASLMENYGSIVAGDSMTNAGTFLNHSGSYLYTDSLLNIGTFTNDGRVEVVAMSTWLTWDNNGYFGFNDMANFATMTNSDSVMGTGSFYNAGLFDNEWGGLLHLDVSFMNGDSVFSDAVFINNWAVTVDQDWYNSDTVMGSGNFIVYGLTGNGGWMLGNFDFCDQTPPPVSPFIDLNTGYIDPNITWCSPTAADEDLADQGMEIWPNPADAQVWIRWDGKSQTDAELLNLQGSKVLSRAIQPGSNLLDVSQLPSGIYFLRVQGHQTRKLVIN